MKRLSKISYLVAAFATIVGTNSILLTPTSAADNTTKFNFGEVEYNTSESKTTYDSGRGRIDSGSDYFSISCTTWGTDHCTVSVKTGLDVKETPYTGEATIGSKTYALSATIVPRKETIYIRGSYTTKTYNGKEQIANFDLGDTTPEDYSKNFVKDNNPVARTNAGFTTRALNATDFENTNPNFDITFAISPYTRYQSSTIVINKADIDPTLSIEDIQYGDTLAPEITGNLGDGEETIYYRAASSRNPYDFTTTAPTEPGRYQAVATVAATDNYNGAYSEATTFEITKRAVTVDVIGHSKTVTYNGNEQKLQGFDFDFEDSLYDLSKISVNGLALAPLTATEVGIYENTLDEAWFTNTDSEHFDVTFNVTSGSLTILKAPVVTPIVKETTPLAPNTGLVTTTSNTTAAATSENTAIIAAIIFASVATLGLYGLIRRHN